MRPQAQGRLKRLGYRVWGLALGPASSLHACCIYGGREQKGPISPSPSHSISKTSSHAAPKQAVAEQHLGPHLRYPKVLGCHRVKLPPPQNTLPPPSRPQLAISSLSSLMF